jgi:hypothetical protein
MEQSNNLAIPFAINLLIQIYDTSSSRWIPTKSIKPDIVFSKKINLDWTDIPKENQMLIVNADIDMMLLRYEDSIFIISKEFDDGYPDPIRHTTNESFTYKYTIFYLQNLHEPIKLEESIEWPKYKPKKFVGCARSQFNTQFKIDDEIISDIFIEEFYPKQQGDNFEFQHSFTNSRRISDVSLVQTITLKSSKKK